MGNFGLLVHAGCSTLGARLVNLAVAFTFLLGGWLASALAAGLGILSAVAALH